MWKSTAFAVVGALQSALAGVAVAFASLAGSAEPAAAWRAAFVHTALAFALGAALIVVPVFVVIALLGEAWLRQR